MLPARRNPGEMMKHAMILLTGLALGLTGCDEKCSTGDACSKECGPCEVALCVAKGICSCKPLSAEECNGGGAGGSPGGDGGGGVPTNEAGMPVQCEDPMGRLVLNEVMIDGDPTEDEEFIELVNVSDQPVRMAGVKITGLRGASQSDRVIFASGCLPANGALAAYADAARWIYEPAPVSPPVAEIKSFSFANTADFDFRLLDSGGVVISQLVGSHDLIDPGVSVNRNPDLGDGGVVQHTAFDPAIAASPARCPNLGTYLRDCADAPGGPPPDGGPPRDGSVATDGTVNPPRDGGPPPRDMGVVRADMGPSACDPPLPGELIINEVMVDAEGDEPENEYIELVNLADRPLAMTNVEVLSNTTEGGAPTSRKYIFLGGCLPARGAVAAYGDDMRVVVEPATDHPITHDASGQGFANSRGISLALKRGEVILDMVSGAGNSFASGVSANRNPDRVGAAFAKHSDVQPGSNSSPGRCANGGAHSEGCAAQ